jgi:hypothetical protein
MGELGELGELGYWDIGILGYHCCPGKFLWFLLLNNLISGG